jgi:hypothetical protein
MKIKITSYNELLEYAEKCFLEATEPGKLKIGKDLDYTIKIAGDSWDGAIDYRVAQYIVDTQKAVDNLFKELGIELAEKDRPIVKFRVKAGCTEIIVEITKTLSALFKNMESKHKVFVATLLCMTIFGVFTIKEVAQYQDKQQERAHQLEMQKLLDSKEVEKQNKLVQIIDSLVDKFPSYAKPNKQLSKNMRPGDTVTNSTNSVTRTKDEFKKQYPGKGKYKAKSVYLDGQYLITEIKLINSRITIESGSHHYDCLSSLNEAESENLFSKVKEAHAVGQGFKLDLKITADFFKGSKQLKNFVIYEIGEPRKGSQTIESLIGN